MAAAGVVHCDGRRGVGFADWPGPNGAAGRSQCNATTLLKNMPNPGAPPLFFFFPFSTRELKASARRGCNDSARVCCFG